MVIGVYPRIIVGESILVTKASPGSTEFQVVKPAACALYERLLRDAPADRERGEVASAITVGKT